jgi:hypothetical protein
MLAAVQPVRRSRLPDPRVRVEHDLPPLTLPGKAAYLVYRARDSTPVTDLAAGDFWISEQAPRPSVATFEQVR